jgi:hypothetical protein
MSRTRLILMSIMLLSLAFCLSAQAAGKSAMTVGDPGLRSAGALAFAPDGVLFVGDSLGAAVYALDLGDQDKAKSAADLHLQGFDEKIAALLGTTASDILINDLAVHPTSKNIYLSVSRGKSDQARPALLKVSPTGDLAAVALDKVRYAKAEVTNAPDPKAKNRRGRPLRTLTITDLVYTEGHVFVAGLSNEEFASNLRQIPYPFGAAMKATSVEIFHGAHGKYETNSPIRTMTSLEVEGEAHLLAAYTCTPLVTFPIEKLIDGGHIKGKTVAELGFGSTPLDLVTYERDDERYVLVSNTARAGMKLKASDIEKATAITEEVTAVSAGASFVATPMGGFLHFDDFDDTHLVVVRRDVRDGSMELRSWSKEWM